MRKTVTTLLMCFILKVALAQSKSKISLYLHGQYNKTIYDRTINNNPWGIGTGLQLFINAQSKFRPTADLTADIYLEDDKVLRIDPDDNPVPDLRGMLNFFGGISWHPKTTIYMSIVGGPSIINGRTLTALKPSFGFYFSEKQKWTGKFSYINVFNRDRVTNQDFGSVSISLGRRLF